MASVPGCRLTLTVLALTLSWTMPLRAQSAPPATAALAVPGPAGQPGDRNAPVTFEADDVQYDRDNGITTASGHVEAWQNDRSLKADRIVFDRNTGVAAAYGNVVLQEAGGQTVFSDYAELTQDMKDGVLNGMRAILAQNGKLAANGARRTDAKINELTRAIYTTCNLCAKDPTKAPLWDIRARQAVQDIDNKRIEYTDAIIDIYGVPVMYLPYLTHPDPSQKRASGLLPPAFGYSSKLGAFTTIPYYYVIDGSSDATISPYLTSKGSDIIDLAYRKRFNSGTIKATGSFGEEKGHVQGHLFTSGQFAIDDTWRWGFDVNRASNPVYIRDFRIGPSVPSLASSVYIEGFGQGSYARTDMHVYQSLTSGSTNTVPFVLPRTQYSYFGEPDALGGRFTAQTGAFNVVRPRGTTDQRANLSLGWSRPALGPIGDVWKFSIDGDSAYYNAHGLGELPNYGNIAAASSVQAMPTASMQVSLPVARSENDGLGTQTIEPIVKLMVSPRGSSYRNGRIPNEDALDVDFTDANLFDRNRNEGVDRLEGGVRTAVGLKGDWQFPGGAQLSGMIGQSYRTTPDPYFTAKSGLRGTVSDIVARQSFTPGPYLDLTARERFDHDNLRTQYADATISAGTDLLRVSAGYLFSTTTPYTEYDNPVNSTASITALNTPRQEASVGLASKFSPWKISGSVRRSLETNQMVGIDAGGSYEDECFIFDVRYYRRYTSVLNDQGDSAVLFNITLKTVGEFGFHAN
jgi:LPS-assembly protein